MEELVKKWLDENELFPFNLTYTENYGGLLSVSFFTYYDYESYLDLIKYKSKFNKSEFIIIPDNLTVIAYGGAATTIIRFAQGIHGSTV